MTETKKKQRPVETKGPTAKKKKPKEDFGTMYSGVKSQESKDV